MIKNNWACLIIGCFIATITLNACAQSHQQNQARLNSIKAIANSAVLLNNQQNIIPITKLASKKMASVNLGFVYQKAFDSLLNKYGAVKAVDAQTYLASSNLDAVEDDLKYYNTIFLAITDEMASNVKYLNFISNLEKKKTVVLSFFGSGRNLNAFNNLISPIIFSTTVNEEAAMVLPQVIFGGIAAQQLLTGNYSPKYTKGTGSKTLATRLKYTVPEDANVNTEDLAEVDKIVAEAIAAKATPGLVVLVAKDGKVIYNKAYGYHTYSNVIPDKVTDIFDLASVTKTTATTPIVMQLVERKALNLDTNIGHYIAKARTLPMNLIKVREVMLHQAGFIPYIPFQDAVKPADHSIDSSALYNTKVADHYYIRKGYFNEVMWPKMLNSPIRTRGKYVYSDISMYVMQDIVERITQKPLDQYAQENFYNPLGMQTAGYLPRNRFAKDQIVPTENDTYFRKTLLEGYVHDQGAALKGGVAGHAGLFSSANDLAIYYQMLLNQGTYGGEKYFEPQTVATFTSKQSNVSRRGLGFDRWDPDLTKKYPSEMASPQTYGHTGYSGTATWVDPARGLVYIFLSNRINPTVSEQINKLGIRRRIQDAINRAIDNGKK
jgi:CubicO group peptidase (beta-lactamase class C family)